jgi:CDP-diacylglycerol--serine O-phosphatidyltransferase
MGGSSHSSSSEAEPNLRRKRRIYLLPNLFTTAALFGGFYAIIAALNVHYIHAAVAIFFAAVMDGLDGRVARWTQTATEFGKEYDSLSDVVAFGLAPAIVMYRWAFVPFLHETGDVARWGWLAAFFYTAAAALRLARFNIRSQVLDKRYFQGLPSPAAAGLMASLVWLLVPWSNEPWTMIPAGLVTLGGGVLMVSPIPYYSFKDLSLSEHVRFRWAIVIPLLLIVIAISPPKMLFAFLFCYALSGPVVGLWRRLFRRRRSGFSP